MAVDSRADLRELEQQFRRAPTSTRRCNLQRLVDTLEARGLDGLVSYYSPNVHYLSGMRIQRTFIHEANGLGAVVFSRHHPEHPIALTSALFLNWFLTHPSWIEDVRPYRAGSSDFADPDTVVDVLMPRSAQSLPWVQRARENFAPGLIPGLAKAMTDLGLTSGRVGFDNPRIAPAVMQELEPDPPEVVDAYGMMKFVRMIKTPEELEVMRESTRLNQVLQEKVVREYTPGMTWRDVDGWYIQTAARLGGVTEGYDSTIYYPRPGDDGGFVFLSRMEEDFELEPGMSIMFDCHGAWNNYMWDGGKTWYVEAATPAAERVGAAIGEATAEMIAAARPGATFGELKALARRVLVGKGLPEDRTLVFFHGMGLESSDVETPSGVEHLKLEEGMCIATHVFHVGDPLDRGYIEEVGVVTADGFERFFDWDFMPHRAD